MKAILLLLALCLMIGLTVLVLVWIPFLLFFLWSTWRGEREAKRKRNNIMASSAPSLERVLSGHTDNVTAVAFSADGNMLYSISNDHTLRFWEVSTGRQTELCFLPFRPGVVAVAETANLGRLVAVGRFHAQNPGDVPDPEDNPQIDISLFNGESGAEINVLSVEGTRMVHTLTFDDNGSRLFALLGIHDPAFAGPPANDDGSRANRLVLYTLDLAKLTDWDIDDPPRLAPTAFSVEYSAWGLNDRAQAALSQNGKYVGLPTGETDGAYGVGIWDVAANTWKHRFGGAEAQPHRIIAVGGNGDWILSIRGDDDKRDYRNGGPEWYDGLYRWDTSNPNAREAARQEAKPHYSFVINSDLNARSPDERLALNTFINEAQLYNMQTGENLQTVRRPQEDREGPHRYGETVWCAALHEQTRRLVTGHADGAIWLWRMKNAPE